METRYLGDTRIAVTPIGLGLAALGASARSIPATADLGVIIETEAE